MPSSYLLPPPCVHLIALCRTRGNHQPYCVAAFEGMACEQRPSFHQTPGQTRHGFLFFRDSEDKSRVHLSVTGSAGHAQMDATFVLTVSKEPGEVHPFHFSSLLRLRLILTQPERGTERGAGDHTHAEGQGQDKESCQGQDASQQAGGHHDLDREGCLQVVELR